MTTHDKIELPPEFRSGNSVPVTVATIKRERMEEILIAAIEADRKRRGEPVGYIMPTAIKQLKAGGNAIVGGVSQGCDVPIYTAPQPAEPSRGEQRIEWLREVRECAEHVATSDYFEMDAAISKLMSVVEREPQPAEPDSAKCAECGAEMIPVRPGKWQHPDCPQSPWAAEPVKVPSDDQWQTLIGWLDRRRHYPTVQITGEVAGDIADLLARYGATTQEES